MTCFGLIKYLCFGRQSERIKSSFGSERKTTNRQIRRPLSFLASYTQITESLLLVSMPHVWFSHKGRNGMCKCKCGELMKLIWDAKVHF